MKKELIKKIWEQTKRKTGIALATGVLSTVMILPAESCFNAGYDSTIEIGDKRIESYSLAEGDKTRTVEYIYDKGVKSEVVQYHGGKCVFRDKVTRDQYGVPKYNLIYEACDWSFSGGLRVERKTEEPYEPQRCRKVPETQTPSRETPTKKPTTSAPDYVGY